MTEYKVLLNAKKKRKKKRSNYCQELLAEESEHTSQISKDIHRTFPQHILMMQKGG